MPVTAAVLLVLGLSVLGCSSGQGEVPERLGATAGPGPSVAAGSEPAGATTAAATSAGEVDPALLAPLTALGPCGDPPQATAELEAVEGLVLPAGAVLTAVTRTDPVVTAQGWVPMTPIQFRVAYTDLDGVALRSVEDEVWEAEVLATVDDAHRLFVKAQAVCESASVFIAVIAPEDAADAVPTPQGG